MSNEDLLKQIRKERSEGELIGPLTDKYGADKVVEALGVMHVARSLGVTTGDAEGRPDDDD